MSNERFDKLMKKNLEAVRPGYQPRAWDRFRKRLPLPGIWPWMMQYGGWVLSGLMLTGWMTTLYTLHENQRMLDTVSKRFSEAVQPVAQKPVSPAGVVQRIDTVYLVRRTVVEHQHFYRPQDGTRSRVPSGSDRRGSPSTEAGVVGQTGKKPNQNLPVGSRATLRPDSLWNRSTADNLPDEKPTTADEPSRSTPSSLQKNDRPDSTEHNEKAASVPPQIPKIEPQRPPFRLSSLRPRVGIETAVARNGVGVGPAIEVALMENLGLSVGLQASQLQAENHRELKDYNSATGQEFIEKYRAYLPAQYDKIEEITIKNTGVSLPVSLKYYVPLGQRWSVLFLTGTSFDLAAYQQIKYESHYRGDEQHHSFNLKMDHRFFQNFVFGGGIQFQQSRISAQLTPYYLYDFRGVSSMPNGNNFGLRASVWLNLFKQ